MSLPESITTARAISAVFFHIVESGDHRYLTFDDFSDEDPEDVRMHLSESIGETLEVLGFTDDAESCGEATDIVLEHMPALNKFLIETSE